MALPILSSDASPEQVREIIATHLRSKYVLDEAEVTKIARVWRHSGKEFQQYPLESFRQAFGLVYGTILWCDERRITKHDQSLLKVDLPVPNTVSKVQCRTNQLSCPFVLPYTNTTYPGMALMYSGVLALILLIAFLQEAFAWNVLLLIETFIIGWGTFMFRMLKPDEPIPLRRNHSDNNKEAGVPEKQNLLDLTEKEDV